MIIMANEEKSYICQEGSRFPFADNYLYFPDNIVNRQEGTDMTICKGCENEIINKGNKYYCFLECFLKTNNPTPRLDEKEFWNELQKDYVAGMSLKACERKYKIPATSIKRGLVRNNIEIRTPKEASILYVKTLLENGGHGGRWSGGKHIDDAGYITITLKDNKRKREHVIIAEKILGRSLRKNECVHHINGNKTDNRHNNLIICTNSYHRTVERRMVNLYIKEHFL